MKKPKEETVNAVIIAAANKVCRSKGRRTMGVSVRHSGIVCMIYFN